MSPRSDNASDSRLQILVVDDDAKLCRLIRDYLEPLGYEVHMAHTGPEGLEAALQKPFSAVILDVMLPGMNGFDVLRELRAKSTVPVLMLTGRGEEPDRIVGLELGADDYLPKTFSTRELLARLRAVIRRSTIARLQEEPRAPQVVVGDLHLDPEARVAALGDQPLTFSSLWTNPLLFDYKPWLAVVIVVILLSVACWLPLIRGLTRSISQLTSATGAIAQGRFETRLSVNRRDELGQLSQAINHMAERLSGFVYGQRRFLGDIAHELCSPIARIQVALGVLEQRAEDNQKEYVLGVQEEVEHMSGLINELLSFSKAGMNASTTPLTRVNVADTVRQVLQREANHEARIETHIDGQLEVIAHPDYLFRSVANIIRNAIRYAGEAGPIAVSASEKGGVVSITVADNGPGIPASELEEVFKPFYRPEFARQRETGGVGLGLAIVRTCVEACGGTVKCRNRSPKGLEAEIRLPAAKP